MNFEQNRKDMLQKLSKLKRENVIKRRIESAKQRIDEGKISDSVEENNPEKIRKKIIIFGKNSFFFRNIILNFQNTCDVTKFEDNEKACDFCAENAITLVFLDMDEPTDWKLSTDLFTTLKMINPDITMFLMTSNCMSIPVQTLEEKGGIVLRKPISFEEINDNLSGFSQ